jgi:hypothetical protein
MCSLKEVRVSKGGRRSMGMVRSAHAYQRHLGVLGQQYRPVKFA